MADGIAIKVDGVSKNFRLPHERVDSVKSLFVNPFQKRLKNDGEIQHALHDISFEVKEGEFFGIVGRNGSGKSTLLKLIAGIYQPNRGSVTVNGRLVPFIELGVGFNPELSGRENVYLNGALMGFSTKEVDRRYHDIVEFAELERFMDQKLKNYSSGMQVRLAFSVATILAQSDVLLIDEVLAVGDADFQRKCFDYFKRLKKEKKTVVFVTHDMDAVRNFCDRAVLIEKSKLVLAGKASEVSDAYSKMFLPQTTVENDDKTLKSTRWGDGEAVYDNVKLSADKANVMLTADIHVKSALQKPKPGFSIKNYEGQILFGSNTQKLDVDMPEILEPGVYRVKWIIPNIMNDGRYIADLSLGYDLNKVADWAQDAAEVRILTTKGTPFLVNPSAEFSMKSL